MGANMAMTITLAVSCINFMLISRYFDKAKMGGWLDFSRITWFTCFIFLSALHVWHQYNDHYLVFISWLLMCIALVVFTYLVLKLYGSKRGPDGVKRNPGLF